MQQCLTESQISYRRTRLRTPQAWPGTHPDSLVPFASLACLLNGTDLITSAGPAHA